MHMHELRHWIAHELRPMRGESLAELLGAADVVIRHHRREPLASAFVSAAHGHRRVETLLGQAHLALLRYRRAGGVLPPPSPADAPVAPPSVDAPGTTAPAVLPPPAYPLGTTRSSSAPGDFALHHHHHHHHPQNGSPPPPPPPSTGLGTIIPSTYRPHPSAYYDASYSDGDATGFHVSIHPGRLVGDIVHDALHAGRVIRDVGHIVRGTVGELQGVISLVPGIGSGISAAIGAGMTILSGGGPLDIALNAAFGAIPIPPGLRDLAHMALEAGIKLATTRNLGDAAIAAIRSQLPAGLPQHIFDTLAHIVLHHRRPGVPTVAIQTATQTIPLTAADNFAALHAIAPTLLPAPPGGISRPPPPAPPTAPAPAPPAQATAGRGGAGHAYGARKADAVMVELRHAYAREPLLFEGDFGPGWFYSATWLDERGIDPDALASVAPSDDAPDSPILGAWGDAAGPHMLAEGAADGDGAEATGWMSPFRGPGYPPSRITPVGHWVGEPAYGYEPDPWFSTYGQSTVRGPHQELWMEYGGGPWMPYFTHSDAAELRAHATVEATDRELGDPLGAERRAPWMGPGGLGAAYIMHDQATKGDFTRSPAYRPQWQSRADLEPEGSRD